MSETKFVQDRRLLALHDELTAFLRRRSATAEEAEDMVQEAFLKFHRAGYDIAAPDGRPLLFAILKNLGRDRARSARRERARGLAGDGVDFDDAVAFVSSDEPGPERTAEAAGELAHIVGCIRDLPARSREVFLLHRFRDMTYREIAAQLGMSISAVEKHLADALKRLRQAREK